MTADAVGGVWTYAVDLSEALRADGHEVTLAVLGPEPPPDPTVLHRPSLLEWHDDPWEDLRATGEWLLELASRLRPDVVHLNSFALAALPWEQPVVVVGHSCVLSWHAAVRGAPAGEQWDRYRAEVARGLHAAGAVVAPSRAMLSELRRLYHLDGADRAIHNGASPHPWPAAAKEDVVLAAGRLWDEAKGLDVLDAAAASTRWPVEVAGDGGHAADVRLLGRLPHGELRARMGRARVFAHPARYEPFGLAPLEAALAGCALVLGDIPTLRELWDDAALFVAPGDADALAAALDVPRLDPDRCEALADAARERAQRYHLPSMARAYGEVYGSLAARGGGDRLATTGAGAR